MGRVTEFWGRKISGNNDNESMFKEKCIMRSGQKLKFSEFEVKFPRAQNPDSQNPDSKNPDKPKSRQAKIPTSRNLDSQNPNSPKSRQPKSRHVKFRLNFDILLIFSIFTNPCHLSISTYNMGSQKIFRANWGREWKKFKKRCSILYNKIIK